jgi:hypothetical protein
MANFGKFLFIFFFHMFLNYIFVAEIKNGF